jgi:hypothetical protein
MVTGRDSWNTKHSLVSGAGSKELSRSGYSLQLNQIVQSFFIGCPTDIRISLKTPTYERALWHTEDFAEVVV